MKPSVWDTSQPHHVVSREDEYGREYSFCACGHSPPYNSQTTGYYRTVNKPGGGIKIVHLLHQHIADAFDGRCHFKRYGMECGRFYGHRGIHRLEGKS